MTLETYGNIAEIFSAVAILITLGYGILQLRINNKLARVQLTNQTGQSVHEFFLALGMDAQATKVWHDGLFNYQSLSPNERNQFTHLCTAAFLGLEIQFRLQTEHLIAQQMFDRGDRQLQFLLAQPGFINWWPSNRNNFNSDFVEYVDRYFVAKPEEELANNATDKHSPQTSP